MNRAACILTVTIALMLDACHPHEHEDATREAKESIVAFTHFTPTTELFVEFPTIVVGRESPFAAHFTWIDRDPFAPVDSGRVTVRLTGGNAPDEVFTAAQPARTGIFRPVAKPQHAGSRRVTVELTSGNATSRHDLGEITVHASVEQVPAETETEVAPTIAFLKEQQWQTEFAHRPATTRTLRQAILATGVLRPRYGAASGEALIAAPASGVIEAAEFPRVGQPVKVGEVLVSIGGAPLTSPINGSIVQVYSSPGAHALRGEPLFHIVDLARLWLEVQVPEADLAPLGRPSGAWFRIEGSERIVTIQNGVNGARLVSFGGTVDPRTRTVPLVFEFNNRHPDLRLGQSIPAYVYAGKAAQAVAVPDTALVTESGQEVVYVLVDGEHFERRAIEAGIRDGGFVEVRRGLKAGERVVTRGAYLVRLAATTPANAGEGHVH